jgi:hypothetical protein
MREIVEFRGQKILYGRDGWIALSPSLTSSEVQRIRARIEKISKEPRPDAYGIQKMMGLAGSIFAFHPNLIHSSSNNLSPNRRSMLLVTYNRVTNAPVSPSRSHSLVSRDTSALMSASSNSL